MSTRAGNDRASQGWIKLAFVVGLLTIIPASTAISGPEPTGAGRIIGRVVDSRTGEPVIGVSVLLQNTTFGAASDLDGRYAIRRVPPGTYAIVVSSIGYAKLTVQDVAISPGEVIELDFPLQPETLEGKTIVVQGRAQRNNEAAMLKHRQAAKTLTDAISSEQISRSGSGDAAEAMAKVVGATVMDGRYVFVRGLGDRYSNTQLNGSLLPTADPEKQAVAMDLVPTSLLDNIVITKSSSPDKAGNFSGGSVNLITKDFPTSRTFTLAVSGGYNSQATQNARFLTFDRGPLTVPAIWDTPEAQALGNDPPGFTQNPDAARFINDLAGSFSSEIEYRRRKAPFNNSFSAAYGDQFSVFGRALGVNAGISRTRNSTFYDDGIDARYKLATTGGHDLAIQHYLHDTKGTEEQLWGGLLNVMYRLHANHELGTSYVRTEGTQTEARFLEGGAPTTFSLVQEDTTSARLEARVLEYNENTLRTLQFKGKHAFGAQQPLRLDWQVSRSRTNRETPDLRFFNSKVSYWDYDRDGEWVKLEQPTYKVDPTDVDIVPTRYFRTIEENNTEAAANLTLPLATTLTLRTGFAALAKDRAHRERLFRYHREGFFSGDPREYYRSIGFDTLQYAPSAPPLYVFKNYITEATTPNEQYSGTQDILGVYGMFDARPFSRLMVSGGVRLESTDMVVENGFLPAAADYAGGKIAKHDWLPAVNLTYNLSATSNLRTAYGRTLARPTLREFAPYGSDDFGASGKLFNGNPALTRTLIDNLDLRWEWFVRPGEVLAVSGFYKHFTDPIELVIVSTNETQIQPQNTDEAVLFGVEIEMRRRLDVVHPRLANFDLGFNLTVVSSRVDVPQDELIALRAYDPKAEDTRPMYGQAPYVANLSVGYANAAAGTALNLHYNRVGKRLSYNSSGGTPDVFEKARTMLDVVASQKLLFNVSLKLAVKNVTDSKTEEVYEFLGQEYAFRRLGTGRSISFGLGYSLN